MSAEELIKGGREIDFRNSASRAYYSCYLEARSYAEKLPEVPQSKGGAHGEIIAKFTEHFVKDESKEHERAIRAIGIMLNQVKTLRTRADYDIDDDYSIEDAKLTIGEVKKINNKIQSL